MVRKKISWLLFPTLIFLFAFLQYANTIFHDFAWDDKLLITGNEYTQQGIDGLPEIFTQRVSVPYKNVYRPVPQALFAVEYELFRQSPHAMHLMNICWYALACVLVYGFMQFVFPKIHPLFHFLGALLFTVHPLHVEVVANIKSRDEILALLFGLITVILLVKTIEQKKWLWLIPVVLCFSISVLSKQNAVTLMPIAALAVWYRGKGFWPGRNFFWVVVAILLLIGFFFLSVPLILTAWLVAVIYTFYTLRWQKGWWVVIFSGVLLAGIFFLSRALSITEESESVHLDATVLNNIFLWTTEPGKVIPTALVNIGRYILLFLYPHPLIHLYGYNQISLSGWTAPETWLILLIIACAVYLVIKMWQQKTPAVFGVLFFCITYSVYSNLFVLAPDTMADRYMFIPSIGLVLIVMEGVFRLGGINFRHPVFTGMRARGVITLLILVMGGYFVRTLVGNRDWKDDNTLIRNRIQYMESNAAAQATLGFILHKESETVPTKDQSHSLRMQAMKAFTRAVEIYPDFYWAWISIGKIFASEGMNDKAELAFLKAQQIEPVSADGYFCLGSLYYSLGDGELAVSYLEKAVLLEPQMEQGYVMLGKAYLMNNSISNLGALAKTATQWFPHNGEFAAMMASYFFRMNQYDKAAAHAKVALKKDPQNLMAITVLSNLPYGDSTSTFITPAP